MDTSDPPLGYNYLVASGPNGAVRACKHISKYYSASVISVVVSAADAPKAATPTPPSQSRFLVFFECKDSKTEVLITADWKETERDLAEKSGVRSSSVR